MRSMTGYGRAVAEKDKNTVTVELTAVNSRKQAEMHFSMPRELSSLEPRLRTQVQQNLSRGNLNISIAYTLSSEAGREQLGINHERALLAADDLKKLAAEAGLEKGPQLGDILMVPGVIDTQNTTLPEVLQELIPQALDEALEKLSQVRIAEGKVLQQDLLARGEKMAQLVEAIEGCGQEALILQQKRLRDRIASLGVELTLDDERLAKELVFYAERADITEEVVRLKSHLKQYAELLNSTGDPGRNLDFLGQEMNREITTLSSKTADLSIARYAFELKGEIGKVREQVLNIE